MYAIANTVTLVNQIITADNAGNMKFDRHSRIRFGLSLLANFGQLSELVGTQAAGTTGKWFTVRQDYMGLMWAGALSDPSKHARRRF